jgi:hypothetical protein
METMETAFSVQNNNIFYRRPNATLLRSASTCGIDNKYDTASRELFWHIISTVAADETHYSILWRNDRRRTGNTLLYYYREERGLALLTNLHAFLSIGLYTHQ